MKVLLTGANGFVGSHILERLLGMNASVVALLRETSDTRFIETYLDRVEVVRGDLSQLERLQAALDDVTHVVHCAGATKALREQDLFVANRDGVANLIRLTNQHARRLQRFVHISSLAAGRPATTHAPAQEDDPPDPQSVYGQSKRAAEEVVVHQCRSDYVILRPGAVYGPRDREFLPLFSAASRGFAPLFGGGKQELSLVFASDVAAAADAALTAPLTGRWVVNVASAEVITTRELTLAIADAYHRKAIAFSLPWTFLRLACWVQSSWARVTRRPTVLAHHKFRELSTPGWVCDTTRLRTLLGNPCTTGLTEGIRNTKEWYAAERWL